MKPVKQPDKIKRSNASHQLKARSKISKRKCPKLSLTPITSFFKRSVLQPPRSSPVVKEHDPAHSTACSSLAPSSHTSLPHSSTSHSSSPRNSTHHRSSPHRTSPQRCTPHRFSHPSSSPHRSTHHRSSPYRSAPHSSIQHRSSPCRSTPHRSSPHRSSPYRSSPHRSTPHGCSPHSSTHHSSSPHRSSPYRSSPHSSMQHRSSPHRSTPHGCSPHSSTHHRFSPYRSAPHRSRSPDISTSHRSRSPHRPISQSFTPHSSTPHKSSPHSSSSKHPRLSPVSRSSATRNRSLTPVKLSSNFEFDFSKIPPVDHSTARKGSPTSLSSRNSSPIAPLFSPISTPSSSDVEEFDLYAAIKTPCIARLSSNSDHTEVLPQVVIVDDERNKSVSTLSDSMDNTIVISSDSDWEDIHKRQGRRTPKFTLGEVDKNGVIVLDCTSGSDDVGAPVTKKVCVVDLSDSHGRSTVAGICEGVDKPTSAAQTLLVDDKTIEHDTEKLPTNILPAPCTSTCSEPVSTEPLCSPATELEALPGQGKTPNPMLTEVEALMWKRGVTYCTEGGDKEKIVLLNTAQNNVTENLLNTDCRFLSDNIYSLVEYLSTITSNKNMPTGESLAKLILIISETHSKKSPICPKVKESSLCYLGQLLLLHPPGQHTLVDSQYRSLLTSLEENSDSFSLWEFLDTLSKGSSYCAHLLSLFVDLLLANYWSTLQNDSCEQPLFLDVFWTNKGGNHVTTPIRNLLDGICEILDNFDPSQENMLKLDSLATLLYLCSTQCEDLSRELVVACKRLRPEEIILLLGRLPCTSLHSQIIKCLPELDQELRKTEQIFNAMISKCTALPSKREDQVSTVITKTEPDDLIDECSSSGSVLGLKKPLAVDVHSTAQSCSMQSTTVLTRNSQPNSRIVKSQSVSSHPSNKHAHSLPATTASAVSRTQVTAKRPTGVKFKCTNNASTTSTTLGTKGTSKSGSKVCYTINGSSKVNAKTTRRPIPKPSTVVRPNHSFVSQKTSFTKLTLTTTGLKCENCKTGTCVRCVQQRRLGTNRTK